MAESGWMFYANQFLLLLFFFLLGSFQCEHTIEFFSRFSIILVFISDEFQCEIHTIMNKKWSILGWDAENHDDYDRWHSIVHLNIMALNASACAYAWIFALVHLQLGRPHHHRHHRYRHRHSAHLRHSDAMQFQCQCKTHFTSC